MQDRDFYINPGHAEQLGMPAGQDHINLHAFTHSHSLRERALTQIAAQLRNDLTNVRGRHQIDRTRRARLELTEDEAVKAHMEDLIRENAGQLTSNADRLRSNVEAAILFLNVAYAIPSSRVITRGSLKDCTLPPYPKNEDEPVPILYAHFSDRIRQAFTQDQLLTAAGSDGTNQLTPLGITIRALSVATHLLYPTS